MDLMDMLANSLMTDSSVEAMCEKTGATKEQAQALVASAIPVFLKSMTENASTQEGARSLRSALDQHTETKSLDSQIKNADMEDGDKIVHHILGDNAGKAVSALASQTSLNEEQVTRGLGSMAPALLSVLFAAIKMMSANQNSSGLDLSNLLGMFGGNSNSSSSVLGSLLGGILGQGSSQAASPSLGGSLLSGLLGGGSQSQASPVGGLLSGLLGGGNQSSSQGLGSMLGSLFGSAPQQSNASAFNGADLLNLLNALK